ncbi:MAG: hypothetical protein IPJ28_15130 [Betaproteobacteria bacterium]|nr:hypothetical protein [Betaproteobacteria bacterium]
MSHEIATQFERILAIGLRTDEIVGFEDQCDKVVANHEGIDIVAILGPDGRSIFRNGKGGQRIELPQLADGIGSGQSRLVELSLPEGSVAAVVTPIFDTGRSVVGAVLVGASQDRIDRSLRSLSGKVLAVGLGFILLSTGILYFALTRFVTRPLVAVIDAINGLRRLPPEQVQPLAVAAQGETAVVVETINSLLAQQKQHLAGSPSRRRWRRPRAAPRAPSSPTRATSCARPSTASSASRTWRGAGPRTTGRASSSARSKAPRGTCSRSSTTYWTSRASRPTGSRLERIDFTLESVVDNLVSLSEPRARAKGLALRVEIPAALRSQHFAGDPLRIGQVLLNLVGNAIKFTERGGVSRCARRSKGRRGRAPWCASKWRTPASASSRSTANASSRRSSGPTARSRARTAARDGPRHQPPARQS